MPTECSLLFYKSIRYRFHFSLRFLNLPSDGNALIIVFLFPTTGWMVVVITASVIDALMSFIGIIGALVENFITVFANTIVIMICFFLHIMLTTITLFYAFHSVTVVVLSFIVIGTLKYANSLNERRIDSNVCSPTVDYSFAGGINHHANDYERRRAQTSRRISISLPPNVVPSELPDDEISISSAREFVLCPEINSRIFPHSANSSSANAHFSRNNSLSVSDSYYQRRSSSSYGLQSLFSQNPVFTIEDQPPPYQPPPDYNSVVAAKGKKF